jgi:membrane protein implicated in regulation of membrane protease activity
VSLLRFLYEFVIGDDWRIAAGVAVALTATALLEWWWVLPVAVAALLALSVSRFAGRRRTSTRTTTR